MTQQLNPLLIVEQQMNSQLPADVSIDADDYGRWHWRFRHLKSENLNDSKDGFLLPQDALCNLVIFLVEEADKMVEMLRNADAPEYWVPDEDN